MPTMSLPRWITLLACWPMAMRSRRSAPSLYAGCFISWAIFISHCIRVHSTAPSCSPPATAAATRFELARAICIRCGIARCAVLINSRETYSTLPHTKISRVASPTGHSGLPKAESFWSPRFMTILSSPRLLAPTAAVPSAYQTKRSTTTMSTR